jgi:hypothetical protein
MKKTPKILTLSLEEAISKKKYLVEECKILGDKFSKNPTRKAWADLQNSERHLKILTVAILNFNNDTDNNSRIKERELLVRSLDVLNKTNKVIENKKKHSPIHIFSTWFKKIIDIARLRGEIEAKIRSLTDELTNINKNNTITYSLA